MTLGHNPNGLIDKSHIASASVTVITIRSFSPRDPKTLVHVASFPGPEKRVLVHDAVISVWVIAKLGMHVLGRIEHNGNLSVSDLVR